MIDTLLFDCDNTLVLSEDLAFAGCAELVNEVAGAHGLALAPFTGASLQARYVGQTFRGMLSSLAAEHGLALARGEADALVAREEDVVVGKLRASLQPCAGAARALAALARSGRFVLAVVSSSARRRVDASLERTSLAPFFGDRVFSAASSMPAPSSKPDPAIYTFALAQLGKSAGSALAVEDSRSGTTSAVRAGITTVGYLGAYPPEEREAMGKVLRDAGAVLNIDSWDEFGDALDKLQKAAE